MCVIFIFDKYYLNTSIESFLKHEAKYKNKQAA